MNKSRLYDWIFGALFFGAFVLFLAAIWLQPSDKIAYTGALSLVLSILIAVTTHDR